MVFNLIKYYNSTTADNTIFCSSTVNLININLKLKVMNFLDCFSPTKSLFASTFQSGTFCANLGSNFLDYFIAKTCGMVQETLNTVVLLSIADSGESFQTF